MITAPGPTVVPTEWTWRLASLIYEIRPDWDEQGIRSAIHQIADRPLALVVTAATAAATTRPDQRTPAIIALDGDHWRQAYAMTGTPQPKRDPITATRCAHGMIERECPACAKAAEERTKAGIAKAREALFASRREGEG